MLCSLGNVKYQLVVGRECFCSSLCLPVDLARMCRKSSRKTVFINGRTKLLLFIQQMSTYYVPGTVLGAMDKEVNQTKVSVLLKFTFS